MATTVSNLPVPALQHAARLHEHRHSLLLATALTPLALFIHGFHPYSEDGGIYLAGVEHSLHPNLFPHLTGFVLAPTQHSGFATVVAALARLTHLTGPTGLPFLVFALHLATIWATLFAASVLAARCWPERPARTGATLLLACWLGLPIAGTSLLFMDPYLTARSFSTPCLILALIGALDATSHDPSNAPSSLPSTSRRRGLLLWIAALILAAILHPLMAGYALLASVALAACRISASIPRTIALSFIFLFALLAAAAIHLISPPDAPAYTAIALTRSYWFLSSWRWYEWVGIAAPTAILTLYSRSMNDQRRHGPRPCPVAAAQALAASAVFCAVLVTLISLLFAHPNSPNHLVAALQPMRGLHFVYLAMMLSLGATLATRTLQHRRVTWVLSLALLALPLYAASRSTSPSTRHLELPALDPGNDWVHAFLWIRTHTPTDALFALPSNYIGLPGEDAQCFRALAERSALPDYSKDGGEAAVAPRLTPLWTLGQSAQATLTTGSDQLRRASLEPLGVSWLVLPAASATHLDCPYANSAAKVCRLR